MMLAVEVPHAISGTVHTTFGVPGDHCSEHSLLPLQPANHPICLRLNPFESPYTLSNYTGATSTDQHGTRAYSFKARCRLIQLGTGHTPSVQFGPGALDQTINFICRYLHLVTTVVTDHLLTLAFKLFEFIVTQQRECRQESISVTAAEKVYLLAIDLPYISRFQGSLHDAVNIEPLVEQFRDLVKSCQSLLQLLNCIIRCAWQSLNQKTSGLNHVTLIG